MMIERRMLTALWVAILFSTTILNGCAPATPSQAQPATPSPAGLPETLPTATAISASPSPSPNPPLPTPTPVPLPETCLRVDFAGDMSLCQAASRYAVDLTIDPEAARVVGYEELRYTNAERRSLDTLYLRLFPNAPNYGGSMTVSNVMLNGEAISPTFELERSAMRLPLNPSLEPGEFLTLTMDFVVEVPTDARTGHGLFSYVNGVMSLPDVFPLVPVYDDEGWNVEIAPVYADDVYADVAIFAVDLVAPADMTVVASGVCTPLAQGRWSCDAAPMREFTLILGQDFDLVNREQNGVVVNSYFFPWHRAGGERAAEVAADALAVFTDLFGPYPYSELDVVETSNYLGGMEYPGLVVVEDGEYVGGLGGLEWLTAHEVAHQWWFGVVGSDQIDDPWLDEALTQYSTMLYYEQVYGEERAANIRQAEFVNTHQRLIWQGIDQPIGLPAADYNRAHYWEIVYDKGALYFHELRQTVGDEAFFDILRTYYQEHRYGIATPASFLAAVEQVTGNRYLSLYSEWVLGESIE